MSVTKMINGGAGQGGVRGAGGAGPPLRPPRAQVPGQPGRRGDARRPRRLLPRRAPGAAIFEGLGIAVSLPSHGAGQCAAYGVLWRYECASAYCHTCPLYVPARPAGSALERGLLRVPLKFDPGVCRAQRRACRLRQRRVLQRRKPVLRRLQCCSRRAAAAGPAQPRPSGACGWASPGRCWPHRQHGTRSSSSCDRVQPSTSARAALQCCVRRCFHRSVLRTRLLGARSTTTAMPVTLLSSPCPLEYGSVICLTESVSLLLAQPSVCLTCLAWYAGGVRLVYCICCCNTSATLQHSQMQKTRKHTNVSPTHTCNQNSAHRVCLALAVCHVTVKPPSLALCATPKPRKPAPHPPSDTRFTRLFSSCRRSAPLKVAIILPPR